MYACILYWKKVMHASQIIEGFIQGLQNIIIEKIR